MGFSSVKVGVFLWQLGDGSTVPVSQRKRQQVIEAIGRL
jgi:hypothetical protein